MALDHIEAVTIPAGPETTGYAVFFEKLDELPGCCLETLSEASKSLAVLQSSLFLSAIETLDKAQEMAAAGKDPFTLLQIANAYRDLAQAAS